MRPRPMPKFTCCVSSTRYSVCGTIPSAHRPSTRATRRRGGRARLHGSAVARGSHLFEGRVRVGAYGGVFAGVDLDDTSGLLDIMDGIEAPKKK